MLMSLVRGMAARIGGRRNHDGRRGWKKAGGGRCVSLMARVELLEGRCLLNADHPVEGGATQQADAMVAKQAAPKAAAKKRIVYNGPITITKGGVYSGNWQSADANVPAVSVRTSDRVVIQNSNIKSQGTLIDALGFAVNLTVKNNAGYALNPNVVGRYPGRFMDIDGFTNVAVSNNYLQGTSGIYLYNYQGNHTKQQTVRVLKNQARNIDGRFSNGNGGFLTGHGENYFVQFFQINGVQGLVGAEVAWNEVINQPYKSRVEENISIHASGGTALSPFSIHDNYIQGAYPADPVNDLVYRGGGIMMSDNGSSYVRAYRNQIVATTNEGMTISSGHDNAFFNNRILSSGLMPNGAPNLAQNVGAIIWNYNLETTFTNNVGYNNLIGWMLNGDQNNAYVPDAASWVNNKDYPGVVTQATEAAEYAGWVNKLAKSRVKIGVV